MKTILSEEPYDKNEQVGKSVELVCVPPDGLPAPKISWLKDGNLIPTDGTNTLINYNGNLIIRAARLQDSGIYPLFLSILGGLRVGYGRLSEICQNTMIILVAYNCINSLSNFNCKNLNCTFR